MHDNARVTHKVLVGSSKLKSETKATSTTQQILQVCIKAPLPVCPVPNSQELAHRDRAQHWFPSVLLSYVVAVVQPLVWPLLLLVQLFWQLCAVYFLASWHHYCRYFLIIKQKQL